MNYKLLGRSGLRVSELCLGTMTFGTEWGWGADYETSKAIFESFGNAGGNFIDTANRYTEGTSEKFLGDFIAADRHAWVLATKYTLFDRNGEINHSGNHRKNMMRSVDESLKRLKTEYIDLFWLHAWDFTTPEEEVLMGLDDLVRSGKVHYIGISDTPAWLVSRMVTISDLRGWNRFVGLQIEYSLIQRHAERELLPMAKALGLGVTPWGVIGGGVLSGKYLKGEQGRVPETSGRRTDRATQIATAVMEVSEATGLSAVQIAINWTRQRDQTVIPIVGARTAAQFADSLTAINNPIPAEAMAKLNEASAIELGFPHDFLVSAREIIHGGTYNQLKF